MKNQKKLLDKLLFWLDTKNILTKELNKYFLPDSYEINKITNTEILVNENKVWCSYNRKKPIIKILDHKDNFIERLKNNIKFIKKNKIMAILTFENTKTSIDYICDVGAIYFTNTIKFCNMIHFYIDANDKLNIHFYYKKDINFYNNLYYIDFDLKHIINSGDYPASLLNSSFFVSDSIYNINSLSHYLIAHNNQKTFVLLIHSNVSYAFLKLLESELLNDNLPYVLNFLLNHNIDYNLYELIIYDKIKKIQTGLKPSST